MFNMVSRDGHVFQVMSVPAVQIDLDNFFLLKDYTTVKCSRLKINYELCSFQNMVENARLKT